MLCQLSVKAENLRRDKNDNYCTSCVVASCVNDILKSEFISFVTRGSIHICVEDRLSYVCGPDNSVCRVPHTNKSYELVDRYDSDEVIEIGEKFTLEIPEKYLKELYIDKIEATIS